MMFRDWPRTLRPASFRGVPFYVEHDTVETGRRLAIHEFPLKDAPYIEDMGRDTNKISVTAYVVGNDSDGHEKALRSACERGGPGTLSLPIDRFEVHCESCSREWKKDKLGLIAFSIKFVREGTGGAALPMGFLASQVGTGALGLVGAIASRLAAVLSVLGRPSLVKDEAALAVRQIAATLDATARALPLDSRLAPDILKAIDDLDRTAESLVRVGGVAHDITATRFVVASADQTAAATSTASTLAASLDTIVDSLRLAVDPDAGARALGEIAAYEAPVPMVAPRTPTGLLAAANTQHIAQALRLTALARYAEAVAARTYRDRRAAIQARADAAELFAAEADRVVPGPGSAEVNRELLTVSARVADLLSRQISDLAPVIIAEAGLSMPSLWWSNRMYGVADRAAEIVARNRATHASFLPTKIEALAR